MEAAVRTLITGSAGFLGRHLKAACEARGDKVAGLDLDNPFGDALEKFKHGAQSYDLVLHCAAVTPHRAAIDSRGLAVGAGGLELDASMFEWARHVEPGRVVYFSSSAAYPIDLQTGLAGPYRLREEDICIDRHYVGSPDAIYGWVKLTGERLADLYRQSGGAVTVVRPFSGYGEDQSADFPFGAFRDRARRQENPFTIWGDGSQVRDWIHVDDIVGGVLAAAERGVDGPVNLCTGVGTSMKDLASLFVAAAGYSPWLERKTDAPSGVAYRVGDPARMLEFYQPKVSIEEGVRRALEVTDADR